jgi:hypothetical protein
VLDHGASRLRTEPLAVITHYRAPCSTNVERVALALAHRGLEVESVVMSYGDRGAMPADGERFHRILDDHPQLATTTRA